MMMTVYIDHHHHHYHHHNYPWSLLSHSSEQMQFSMFYLLWSLKEAFVKAIGQGLGFNLLEVCCLRTTECMNEWEDLSSPVHA